MTGSDLAAAPAFERDRRAGIDRYRLADPDRSVTARRVAPISTDRFVWLYAGDESPTLGVLDAEAGTYRPAASVTPDDPTPWVDPDGGTAYVLDGHTVTAHEPTAPADARTVGRFAPEAAGDPTAGLTRSADGVQFGAVFAADSESRLATLSTDGTTSVWHTRERSYDTLRFSPSDASLALLARDATDGVGGEAWLAREGLGARPLGRLLPDHHRCLWWGEGGTGLWYVSPGRGVGYLHLESGQRERVWETSARDAHATRSGDLLAATVRDGTDYRVAVARRDGDEGRYVSAAVPVNGWAPRPQFVCGDRWLAYTATVDGRPRATLLPSEQL